MRHEVGIRELRDGLSRWIEKVKAGDEVVVTDHGKPVARLTMAAPREKAKTWEEHIARLAAEGRVILPTEPARPFIPLDIEGVDLSRAILEDREERDRFLADQVP